MARAPKRETKSILSKKARVDQSTSRTHELIARIRQRREAVRQRVGVLTESAALIRDDRNR
jgi:hypothetical protein